MENLGTDIAASNILSTVSQIAQNNGIYHNGSSTLNSDEIFRSQNRMNENENDRVPVSERPTPIGLSHRVMQQATSSSSGANKSQGRFARSAFCPCFSPNVSDDEESGDELTEMGESGRHRGEIAPGHQLSQRDGARRHILAVARDFRSRLAFSADATAQQAGPSGSRGFHKDVVVSDEPYVVHTSIDYTNCLVPELDKITASCYYWGVMDRYEAEALLDNKPEGTFLLRDSAQSEYLFSVSFRRYKRTLHARIEQKNHRFSFDFSDSSIFSAKSITELVAYYNDPAKCLFFEPQLTIPLPRNFVFSLQHLCRARIASLTTYSGVDQLNLPSALKRYIQEYFYKHPVKTVNHIPRSESLRAHSSSVTRPYNRAGLNQ